MSWLDDLIGPSGEGDTGWERWLSPPSFTPAIEQFGQGAQDLFQNIIPWQYSNRELSTGIPDLYHGAMGLIGAPKSGIDEIAALGYDALNQAPAHLGNEAGQALYHAATSNPLDFGPGMARAAAEKVGAGEFVNRLGENIGGMATDPTMLLMPESKALGLAFAPGAAEQVYGGLKEGGQAGLADVLTGGGMLGMIAAAHAPDLFKRPALDVEGKPLPQRIETPTPGQSGAVDIRGLTPEQAFQEIGNDPWSPIKNFNSDERMIYSKGRTYIFPPEAPKGPYGVLGQFNPLKTGEEGAFKFGGPKDLPPEVADLLNFNKSWPADSRFPPTEDIRPTPETLFHGSETPLTEIPAGAWLAKTPEEAGVYGENIYPIKSEGIKNIPAEGSDIFGQELQKQGIAQRTEKAVPITPEVLSPEEASLQQMIADARANKPIDMTSLGGPIPRSGIDLTSDLSPTELKDYADRITQTALEGPAPIKDITPKSENLSSFVQSMKDKYGQKAWKNSMSAEEGQRFETLASAPKPTEAPPAIAPEVKPQVPEIQSQGERIRGSSDVPLAPVGEQQISDVGSRLASKGGFDEIHASTDLQRTAETAAIISQHTKAPLVDAGDSLHAWHLGGLEGQPTEKAIPIINQLVRKAPDAVVPGRGPESTRAGESFNQFKGRSLGFVKKLMDKHDANPNSKIAAVTHVRVQNLIDGWVKKGAKPDLEVDKSFITSKGEHNGPGSTKRLYRGPDGNWKFEPVDITKEGPLEPGVYVIRHGVTDWNTPEEIKKAGGGEPPLTGAKEPPLNVTQFNEAKAGKLSKKLLVPPKELAPILDTIDRGRTAPPFQGPPRLEGESFVDYITRVGDKAPPELLSIAGKQGIEIPKPPQEPPKVIPPGGPKEPPKPKPPLQTVGPLARATLPAREVIAKASPELSQRESSYRLYKETETSKGWAEIERAQRELGSKQSEERVGRFLDGQNVVLTAKEAEIAKRMRALTDEVAQRAGDEGVLKGYRKNYFSHIFDATSKVPEGYIGPEGKGIGERPYGPLEKARETARQPLDFSLDTLKKYVVGANKRIAEAKFLKPEEVNPLLKGQRGRVGSKELQHAQDTAAYASKYLKAITGREAPLGPLARATGKARYITALGDLGKAAISQFGQAGQTFATVGMRRGIRSAVETLRNYRPNELKALSDGSLWPSITHEMSSIFGDASKFKNYMHGVSTADKWLRVHSDVAGRMLAEDALKGNQYAIRQLKEVGLGNLKDPELAAKAGKAISDKTQFRTDTPYMPLWAHSPMGRLATQYSAFMYQHGMYVRDLFKHPFRNSGQIARLAGMGALILGEGIGDTKAALNAVIPSNQEDQNLIKRMIEGVAGDSNFDHKPFFQKLQQATTNKRIPASSPAWRALQNFSQIGGIGIFQTLLEKATKPADYATLPLGPVGKNIADIGQAGYKDIQNIGKGRYFPRETGKIALQNAPLPVVNTYKLANYLMPNRAKYQDIPIELPDYRDFQIELP